jgi:Tn3 transposase DDE domain
MTSTRLGRLLYHRKLPNLLRCRRQLRKDGFDVSDEDVARLSPLGHEHINMLGRYAFSLAAETVKRFEFRGSNPKLGTVNKWRRALEVAGVEFIDEDDVKGAGVRFKESSRRKRR